MHIQIWSLVILLKRNSSNVYLQSIFDIGQLATISIIHEYNYKGHDQYELPNLACFKFAESFQSHFTEGPNYKIIPRHWDILKFLGKEKCGSIK